MDWISGGVKMHPLTALNWYSCTVSFQLPHPIRTRWPRSMACMMRGIVAESRRAAVRIAMSFRACPTVII
jgi:hypothetical protein